MPTTNFGTVVVDTSMVPYIRPNRVEFAAYNLKPYTLSKLFFDDVAVNRFCQNANRLVIESKKSVVLSRNNAVTISPNHDVYQGTTFASATFSGKVLTFDSSSNTVVIHKLTGNFDDSPPGAILFFRNPSSAVTYARGNRKSGTKVTTIDGVDSFYPGEGIVAVERNNCFATVIATVGENVLYVNKNYYSLNVSAVGGNSISSMTQDYKIGDIVYQTADGTNRYDKATFRAEVVYYNRLGDAGVGSIALKAIHGYMNANSTASSTNGRAFLWNTSNTTSKPLGIIETNIADFKAQQNVMSVTNTTVKINVASYSHKSSVITDYQRANTRHIYLNSYSDMNPQANGNLIYFVSGTGVGTVRRIVAMQNTGGAGGPQVVMNSAISFTPDSTTYYSLGSAITDELGSVCGIFNIPSYSNYKFKVGERRFTITDRDTYDDPDFTMRAQATYSSGGLLTTTQRIQTTPILPPTPETDSNAPVRPITPSERTFNSDISKPPVTGSTGSAIPIFAKVGDGLSQTFFTPKPYGNQADYGIFVSHVDLFFKRKPIAGYNLSGSTTTNKSSILLPVTVYIAEVVNGYPTKNYLAKSTLSADKVVIADVPYPQQYTFQDSQATNTKFFFDDLVYLLPDREYALTIRSDSPDYEVFISELGGTLIGGWPTGQSATPTRISEQPYNGVLFRAQNGSTWSPYQNQDLMFTIWEADFDTSGTAVFNIKNSPLANTDVDRVMLVSTDLSFPASNVNYKLKSVYSGNSSYDSLTTGIPLTPFKPVEYGLLADASGKTRAAINRRRILRGNANSMLLTAELTTTNRRVSPVVNLERIANHVTTYYINNAGLSNTLISVTNQGAGYNALTATSTANVKGSTDNSLNTFAQLYRATYWANNANIGLYSITISGGGPNATGAKGFAVANTDGAGKINQIVLASSGSGYIETPTISIESGNATSTTQAYALVNGETSKSGGNMLARYITRQVVLEDGFEAGDLRVFMDAIRPGVTDIQVYYKVLSPDDTQPISEKTWHRMEKVKDITSKDGRSLIGLEFRPSLTENKIYYTENGAIYPPGGVFKSFQIKVCLISSDPATVPKIKNLRINATPEG